MADSSGSMGKQELSGARRRRLAHDRASCFGIRGETTLPQRVAALRNLGHQGPVSRWRMTKKRPRISGTRLDLVLTGLAVLACSCSAQPSDSVHRTDSSSSNGGYTNGGSGPGGEGGHGSGGAAGGGSEASRDAASGMGSGGQAGRSGGASPGAGGSGSGGDSGADAATNRDSGADAATHRDTAAADLPANPDAPAKLDAAPAFWTTPFVANCTPPSIGGRSQSDGHHRAGEDCMQSGCHTGGSPDAGTAFLFGGTVRRAGSLASYPSVEVAIKTQSELYSACSATNGNFWIVVAGAGSLDWDTATVRVRSSNGETAMVPVPEAGCNSCHSEIMLITAP